MKKEECYIRGKIVVICEAVLAEEIGIIAASRRLSALGFNLLGTHAEDFSTFDAVDTESDHLPVDKERKNWSAEAPQRKDVEIAEAEAIYKDNVVAACRRLIERFAIYSKIS